MSIIEKPKIGGTEQQEGTTLMTLTNPDGAKEERKENVLGVQKECSAPGAQAAVAQDQQLTTSIHPPSASRVEATAVASKAGGASALSFQLKAKATPLYYQNPNSNLHQMQLLQNRDSKQEVQNGVGKTHGFKKGSTTIVTISGPKNQIPTKLMSAAALNQQTWRVLKHSNSSQELEEATLPTEPNDDQPPIDDEVYQKMIQPKTRRSSAYTYVDVPHVAALAHKANTLLKNGKSHFQRLPLNTAREKYDVKIVGRATTATTNKRPRMEGEYDSGGALSRRTSEPGSSLQSNEVLIPARHRKKYRALKKKMKRQQSQRHYEQDQRKDHMQRSNINFLQCRYPDQLLATMPPKQARRPMTGSRSAAVLESLPTYKPDSKEWTHEHHRFVKGANQNANFVQTMKIKGLAERHAQLGQARPSTAMVLGGAGSVRTIAAQQKQALTDRELFNFQNARKLAKQHLARPVQNKITPKNYIQKQYEMHAQSNTKSKFLKKTGQQNTNTLKGSPLIIWHQMEGGHRTARTGATQADMLDSMPERLLDLHGSDNLTHQPAGQQPMQASENKVMYQQMDIEQSKRGELELPDSQHSSVRTHLAPSGQTSPKDKLKTMPVALTTKILQINQPVMQEQKEQKQQVSPGKRISSATAAPMKVQVKLTPPPQDVVQENILDETAMEQSPLTARLPHQSLEALTDMGEELPARRNTQTIFKRIAPIVSHSKLKILKKHPDFDNFIALEQKFLEKEDSPHRNIKMSKRENAKTFLKDYLKYTEHNLEAPKGISNNVDKQLQRDKNKIQKAQTSRSPSFVGFLIGKSIEKSKLKRWKEANDHFGFSRTLQKGQIEGYQDFVKAQHRKVFEEDQMPTDAQSRHMVHDKASGKFVTTENRGGDWVDVTGSGLQSQLGQALEAENAAMNGDAQNALKVRVRRRATSNYQQRRPLSFAQAELNADLDVGYHELKDTQYSRLSNYVHDHHKKTISKTCARLIDEEKLDKMRDLPLADILGFMQPGKQKQLKQLRMGLKIQHIDQNNIQQAVYDAMCQSNFIDDKYLQKTQPGPDGSSGPASLTISDLRMLQKLTDPRKLSKILERRSESNKMTNTNYQQRQQRPKSAMYQQRNAKLNQITYTVAQYLQDVQSEGSNGGEGAQELAEDGVEDANRLSEGEGGQKDKKTGHGSGESGSRRESPCQDNKVNRNYGKRKSEAKAFGEVLDPAANQGEYPHHHSVHAAIVQQSLEDRLGTARTSLVFNSLTPVEPEFVDVDVQREQTNSGGPDPAQQQVPARSSSAGYAEPGAMISSYINKPQKEKEYVRKPEGQMWQELQQFVSVGIAGIDEGDERQSQHLYSWNNQRHPKETNRGKKNQATGHPRQGSRTRQRQQEPTDPVIFENKGLKSAFRPKTATGQKVGSTNKQATDTAEINQDLAVVTGYHGKKTIEIRNMPKTSRLSKADMVQDISPELFKVEKKRITEKPLEVNQVVRQPERQERLDFWEQELRILQEEAALRSRSNLSGADQTEAIQVPGPGREAAQRSASKSDSRISESELFQSSPIKLFQIKAFSNQQTSNGKLVGSDSKNTNQKIPPQLRNARNTELNTEFNTDLADLRFDQPRPYQPGRVDEVLHVAGRSYRSPNPNPTGPAGFRAIGVKPSQQQSAQTTFPDVSLDQAAQGMLLDSTTRGQEPTGPSGFADSPNRGCQQLGSTQFEDTLPRVHMSPDTASPQTSPRRRQPPDMPTAGADQDQVESSLASRATRLRPTEVALFGSREASDGTAQ